MIGSGQARVKLVAAARHLSGFGASGAIAFTTDATILELLTRFAAMPPLGARLVAIACAMVAGWQSHRRLTFNVQTPATVREFLAYVAMASTSASINYLSFAAILFMRPATAPFVALVGASLIAMIFAYAGMRFGVFRRKHSTPGD